MILSLIFMRQMSDVSRSADRTDIPLQMQIRPYGATEAKMVPHVSVTAENYGLYDAYIDVCYLHSVWRYPRSVLRPDEVV